MVGWEEGQTAAKNIRFPHPNLLWGASLTSVLPSVPLPHHVSDLWGKKEGLVWRSSVHKTFIFLMLNDSISDIYSLEHPKGKRVNEKTVLRLKLSRPINGKIQTFHCMSQFFFSWSPNAFVPKNKLTPETLKVKWNSFQKLMEIARDW